MRPFSAGFLFGCSLILITGHTSLSRAAAPDMASFKPAPLFDAKALSVKPLTNGVRGIVRTAAGSGLVCVQVWVKAGARYESDNNSGVSRLLAQVGLNGSKNYPSRAEAGGTLRGGARESLETIGGDVKTFTSRDATFLSVTLAAQYLPQALRALSDAVLRPDLSNESIAEARVEMATEQRRREDDALDASLDIAYRLAFEKHPYRKPAGGTSHSIETVTSTVARSFHQKFFVGPNLTVVVVGDAERDVVNKLIAQFFADATATRAAGEKASISAENAPPSFKTLTRRFATRNKIMTLGFRSPGIVNPTEVVAADILLAHWKEGEAAHLRAILLGPARDENDDKPLPKDEPKDGAAPKTDAPALGFDVDYLTQHDPGLLTITLVVNPDAPTGDAVGLVMDEIEKVQREGLNNEALARAKQSLIRQYVAQSDTVSGQAGALGFYDVIGDYNFAVLYLDRIAHITSDDVKRVAQKYLSRTSYVQVVAEPLPTPRPKTPGAPLEGGSGSITASIPVPLKVPVQAPVRTFLHKP